MKNMVELIIDDEKIRREGKYNVQKFTSTFSIRFSRCCFGSSFVAPSV